MKTQEKKRQLAGLLLSPHDGGESEDRVGGLHVSAADEILFVIDMSVRTNDSTEPESSIVSSRLNGAYPKPWSEAGR